jgi:hypothetical protein
MIFPVAKDRNLERLKNGIACEPANYIPSPFNIPWDF